MKKNILLAVIFLVLLSSCKKFLDINSDPDTPQTPDPTSVFIPFAGSIARAVQFDARWLACYSQMWGGQITTDLQINFEQHGYNGFTADRCAEYWRQVYFGLGKNVEYTISEGIKKGQWDVVGASLALKAYMFQSTTLVHGEIIFKDAFNEDSVFFRYDKQEDVFKGVDSMARLALFYLARTDYDPQYPRLSRGDLIYNGNTTRWRQFANGILARNFSALSNKSFYQADSVIKYCDLAIASGADDCLIPFDGTRNDDANFFGTFRNNLTTIRQSDYIVRLLDGRVFAGSNAGFNRDPRMRHMLACSPDTTNGNGGYRGVVMTKGDPNRTNTRTYVSGIFADSVNGNPGSGDFSRPAGKYLFQNKAALPIMTYSEMQFLKAEAAMRKTPSDRATAYTAYRNGITGHFDFINRTSYPRSNLPLFNITAIPAAARTAYLAGQNVKQSSAALTLADIMQQKYIALWGWGFVETWTDMRRYHYTDIDPLTAQPVYSGMVMPLGQELFGDNAGAYVYRVRPRYNSEYVWNIYLPRDAYRSDYHTIQQWFSLP
jgi:hypothetical protein